MKVHKRLTNTNVKKVKSADMRQQEHPTELAKHKEALISVRKSIVLRQQRHIAPAERRRETGTGSADLPVHALDGRTRHAFEKLGVRTARSLLALKEEDVLDLPGCGLKTWRKIFRLQKRIANKYGVDRDIVESHDHDKDQREQLESVVSGWTIENVFSQLGVRAQNALRRLNVNDTEYFLSLTEQDIGGLRGYGTRTWIEIRTLQRQLGKRSDFEKGLLSTWSAGSAFRGFCPCKRTRAASRGF